MKKFGSGSIVNFIRFAINSALILEFTGLIYYLVSIAVHLAKGQPAVSAQIETNVGTLSSGIANVMITLQNPNLGEHVGFIKERFSLFVFIYGLFMIVALVLVTFQLRSIFKAYDIKDSVDQANPGKLKNISIIILIWVLVDFVLRFIPQYIIPNYFITSSIGLNSFHHDLYRIDFKLLTISVLLYLLSVAYEYGNRLKEENSLTI